MRALEQWIRDYIHLQVEQAKAQTRYRPPLVGFAAAADPRFAQLRLVAEPSHYLPTDLLSSARSVVAFFVPFALEVVDANRVEPRQVAQEWALAYVETNALINHISQGLVSALAGRGIPAVTEPSTHNWDPVTLVSRWSHKSVAVIAGLGGFGLHRMLITPAGCAGRCGSVVLETALEPTSPPAGPLPNHCKYYVDQSCTVCVERCPVGALKESGLDKQLCYRWLLHVAKSFEELGLTDVCGKCAAGPCALSPFV